MLKKIKEKIKKIFDDEKVNDIVNVFKFIIMHGFLGLFVLLCIVSIVGIHFVITDMIRQSWVLTITVFLMGSGSAYYMLMDLVKFFMEFKMVNRR